MKRLFTTRLIAFFAALMLHVGALHAVIAYPGFVDFRQPDGTVVRLRMMGNENICWAETEDGYTLVYDKEGYFVYARLDDKGDMLPTALRAANIGVRSKAAQQLLATLAPHLRYSRGQMKAVDQVVEAQVQARRVRRQASYGGVTGTRRYLVILMQYPDLKFTRSKAEFEALFNQIGYSKDGNRGSVRDFYRENSFGQLDLTSDVLGIFTAAHNASYYGAASGGSPDANAIELAFEAVEQASRHVSLSDYDNDHDGCLDGVHIIYAGHGEEAGGGANTIWAHESTWSPAIAVGGIKMNTYSCSPELRGATGNSMTYIGVACHEIGHALGANDYYDTDYETGGLYPATGTWDLMASGSWNGQGSCPAHFNPYVKIYDYGWSEAWDGNQAATVTLKSKTKGSFCRIDTKTPGEFFLLEYRSRDGFDSYIPGSGLMVYRASGNLSKASSNTINASHPQQFYPLCANAPSSLPTSVASSYGSVDFSSAPFPGSLGKKSLTDDTYPSMKSWAGARTGYPITNIKENVSARSVTFDIAGGGTEITPETDPTNPGTPGGGGGGGGGDYLSFTVSGASVTFSMAKAFYDDRLQVEYSTNKSSWQALDIGYDRVTVEAGQTIYFRSASSTVKTSMVPAPGWVTFHMDGEGSVAAGGNVMSLLDRSCSSRTVGENAFANLFSNCRQLTTPPALPATRLGKACYASMFQGCTNLRRAPELPAYSMEEGCYEYMFKGCTNLSQAPELPAMTLAPSCYSHTFSECTSLVAAPALPATVTADHCYDGMFYGCTGITRAPELAATYVATGSYRSMFNGCFSLTEAPALPATELSSESYASMFQGCANLVAAPTLPATRLTSGCYTNMFKGTSITQLRVGFLDYNTGDIKGWLDDITTTGVLYVPDVILANTDLGIPATWTVEDNGEALAVEEDASRPYFSLTAAGGEVTINMEPSGSPSPYTMEYSTDRLHWTKFYAGTTGVIIPDGETRYFRTAYNTAKTQIGSDYGYWTFVMSGNGTVAAGGNIMSLLDKRCEATEVGRRGFYRLFENCTLLTAAPLMPATVIADNSYEYMFSGCTALTEAVALPAKKVPYHGYEYMFRGCTNLKRALPITAETVGNEACWNMFNGCTSLTEPPAAACTSSSPRWGAPTTSPSRSLMTRRRGQPSCRASTR